MTDRSNSRRRNTVLDLFRGLAIIAMICLFIPRFDIHLAPWTEVSNWHGSNIPDLIFAMFLFLSGASIAYSKRFETESSIRQLRMALSRVLILFFLGMLLNAFPFTPESTQGIRIMGVLQRIAIAYGLAYMFILFINARLQGFLAVSILIIYYLIFILSDAVDPFTLEDNISRQVDLYLIGKEHMPLLSGIPFEPEGILGCISASISVWVGYFIARILRNASRISDAVPLLSMIAMLLIGLGLAWDISFPINRYLWSSSFVLYSSGICTIILVGILLIPAGFIEKRCAPIFSMGANPLLLYLISVASIKTLTSIKIAVGEDLTQSLYSWIYDNLFSNIFGPDLGFWLLLLIILILLSLSTLVLYKKKIFLKI